MEWTTVGEELRRLRQSRRLSLRDLASVVHFHASYLSKVETGHRDASPELVIACDAALNADGALIALLLTMEDPPARVEAGDPWETAELLRRIELSEVGPATLEGLQATVERLCCDYAHRSAKDLRREAQRWLRHVSKLVHGSVNLREHRELMVTAGWLALLIGCVEYDLGMEAAAEVTRAAAGSLGIEADHAPLIGWSHEMSAWFAVTQGRYRDALYYARAGQEAAGADPVSVQLAWQEGKALARIGSVRELHDVLDRAQATMASMERPQRPENHFVIDPDKWDFYAMDCYRMAGVDDRAEQHAAVVIAHGAPGRDGVERTPMRVAEARLSLGVVAARRGEAEEAAHLGHQAFVAARRSLPSLLSGAAELDRELAAAGADVRLTREFREDIRRVRTAS